jgi:hypothetical protein
VSHGSPGRWSRVDLACQVGIGLALVLFAVQGLFADGQLRPVQDHTITYSFSQRVAEAGEYDSAFAYPLPAVVFKLALGALGLGVSSVLWSALSILSVFAALRATLILLGRERCERAWLAAALGFVGVIYFVQWDLRAVNSNSVYLALLLWSRVWGDRGRAGVAGGLLAAAIALKLYAAIVLLHLLLRGRREELHWTALWGLALFAGLPALYFGPVEAFRLTGLWLETVVAMTRPDFLLDLVAYKVSLAWVMLSLSGAVDAFAAGVVDVSAIRAAHLWTRALQLAWLVAVGAHLWVRGRRPATLDGGCADLVDYSLLLTTMLVLSPLLEPHHGAVLLAPAVVLADACLDDLRSRPERWLSGVALAVCAIAMRTLPSGLPKALGVQASLLMYSSLLIGFLPGVPRRTSKPSLR